MNTTPQFPHREDPDPCSIICTILAGVGLLLSLEQKVLSRIGGDKFSKDLRAVRKTRLAIEDMTDSIRTLRRFWRTWKSIGEERCLRDDSLMSNSHEGMQFGMYGRFFSDEEYIDFCEAYDEALRAIGILNRALAATKFVDHNLDPFDAEALTDRVHKLRHLCNSMLSQGPIGRVEDLLHAADGLVRRLRSAFLSDGNYEGHGDEQRIM